MACALKWISAVGPSGGWKPCGREAVLLGEPVSKQAFTVKFFPSLYPFEMCSK